MYDLVGEAFWSMHWHWAYVTKKERISYARYGGNHSTMTQHPIWKDRVQAVYAYDSIAFFARAPPTPKLTELTLGNDSFGYGAGHPSRQSQLQTKLQREARHRAAMEAEGGSGK